MLQYVPMHSLMISMYTVLKSGRFHFHMHFLYAYFIMTKAFNMHIYTMANGKDIKTATDLMVQCEIFSRRTAYEEYVN